MSKTVAEVTETKNSKYNFTSPFKYKAELERNDKLDPQFKTEWVAALLSGDFKQAKKALCRIDNKGKRFCCLGVASDMYRVKFDSDVFPVRWTNDPVLNDDNFVQFVSPKGRSNNMPTDDVTAWAYGKPAYKVSHTWCVYVDEKDAKRFLPNDYPYRNFVHLPELNDRGVTFKSIAYLVEKYL